MLSLAEYEALVLRAFASLMGEFTLTHESTTCTPPEYYVRLRGRFVRLRVCYEVDGLPWVVFEALDPSTGERIDSSSLTWLLALRARGPDREEAVPADADALFSILQRNAIELRQYGSDVMNGDFQDFRRLHEIARESVRAWDDWRRGRTSSGEPPRR